VYFFEWRKNFRPITETFNSKNMESIRCSRFKNTIHSWFFWKQGQVTWSAKKSVCGSFSLFKLKDWPEPEAEAILAVNEVESGTAELHFPKYPAECMAKGPVEQNVRARMQEWQYIPSTQPALIFNFCQPLSVETESTSKIWIWVDSRNFQILQDLKCDKWSKFGQIIRSILIQIHLLGFDGHGNPLCGIAAGESKWSNSNMLGMNGCLAGAQFNPQLKCWIGMDEGNATKYFEKPCVHILK